MKSIFYPLVRFSRKYNQKLNPFKNKESVEIQTKKEYDEEYEREKKDRTLFSGKYISLSVLVSIYITSIIFHSTRKTEEAKYMIQEMLNDYQDVTPEKKDLLFLQMARLSSNEYNWPILKRYIDAMIYLFKYDDDVKHKSETIMFLTNMMRIKECREKIYQEIELDKCLNVYKNPDLDLILGDRMSKFIFYYLKYLPNEKKEKFTPTIIDIALSENTNIRKWISNAYPVCTLTPELETFLTKLLDFPNIESEVKINIKKALKKFFNPRSWLKALTSPTAVSLYLFTIGTFWGSVIIKTIRFRKIMTSFKDAYQRALIASLYSSFMLIPSFFIQEVYQYLEPKVFSEYDNERLVPLWMFVKYSIELGYLFFALRFVSNLYIGFVLGKYIQYDQVLFHKLGFGYLKSERLK